MAANRVVRRVCCPQLERPGRDRRGPQGEGGGDGWQHLLDLEIELAHLGLDVGDAADVEVVRDDDALEVEVQQREVPAALLQRLPRGFDCLQAGGALMVGGGADGGHRSTGTWCSVTCALAGWLFLSLSLSPPLTCTYTHTQTHNTLSLSPSLSQTHTHTHTHNTVSLALSLSLSLPPSLTHT